jgi:hypothetical protein
MPRYLMSSSISAQSDTMRLKVLFDPCHELAPVRATMYDELVGVTVP